MYESFYGLSGSPFLLNPDPAFFFGSRGHSAAFAHLQFGLYQAEGFIVITGEVGAGKTTLLRNLIEKIDVQRVVAAQIVSTQLEADDLLRAVAVAFGLPVRDQGKAQLLGTIEAFLTGLVPQGKRALLIVDEAQNLTPAALEELRMLSNFQLGTQALLQSFLVGQPQLRQLLQATSMQQLRQRIVSSFHLGPLAPEETRKYIEHRLRHVGWRDDPRIDGDALDQLHEATGGIPRRINAMCNRLLLFGFLEGKHELGVTDVQRVIDEMRDELGVALSLPVAAAVTEQPAPDLPRTSSTAGPNVRPFAIASIAARLDRIERQLTTLLELVRVQSPAEKRTRVRGPDRPHA